MVGNLHSPSLFIDRGVEFQGSCRMDPLDGPKAERPPERGAERAAERGQDPTEPPARRVR